MSGYYTYESAGSGYYTYELHGDRLAAPCRCTQWRSCGHCASLKMTDADRALFDRDREEGRRLRCKGHVGGCLGHYFASDSDRRWGRWSCKCINGRELDLASAPWNKEGRTP